MCACAQACVVMTALLWIALAGTWMWASCIAADTMEGCRIAIMDFNDPELGLPHCDVEARYSFLLATAHSKTPVHLCGSPSVSALSLPTILK